jgi:hypothetical protein
MASAIYPKFKEALLQASSGSSLAGSGTTGVYAALLSSTYTYSAAHQYYSDLTGIVGTPVELGTKTFVGGLLDAADSTWSSVSGSAVNAVALYVQNAGANTTWRLVAYIDGISITPNGGNITAVWNASGIVQL